MANAPAWRRTVDAVDDRLSGRLERVVRNDNFAIAVGVVLRGRREIGDRVTTATTAVLHAFNLPAKRDLDRLLRHVATLEREVLALSDRGAAPVSTAAVARTETPATRAKRAAKDSTA